MSLRSANRNGRLWWVPAALIGVLSGWAVGQDVGPPAAVAVDAEAAAPISEYVRRVFQDRDGHLWCGTNGDGVCRWDGASLTFWNVKDGLAGSAIRGIVQDGDGAMWFGTDGGVSRWRDGEFRNYTVADGLRDNDVWSLMRDSRGRIWVGSRDGVCRLEGDAFVAFDVPRAEVEQPRSRFAPTLVWSMFEDAAGNIWFGTDGEGARRFDGSSFTTFTTKDGLLDNQVGCILGDRRGRIWFGAASGGVACYEGGAFRAFTAKDGLSVGRVWTMLEDRAGNLWISTLGNGVCRYDGTSFTAFGAADGLTKTHVQSICESADGTLWFGCSGGLFRFDGRSFVHVAREGPWGGVARRGAAEVGVGAMAALGRLEGGEWRMKSDGVVGLNTRWTWGPGQHSLRGTVGGTGGDGKPWRALNVVYWHPGLRQVRMLGLSQYRAGVAESSLTVTGDVWETVTDMYQADDHRMLKSRWTFRGADGYHDELMESTGAEEYFPLASWDWVRAAPAPALQGLEVEGAARPSERLMAFAPLLDHTWRTSGEGRLGGLRSTIQWIPLSNVLCVRTVRVERDAASGPVLDAYFYYHTGKKSVRCLALTEDGGVYEGDVRVVEGGAVEVELKGYERERVVAYVARLDFEKNGAVRQRVWSVEGAERRLVLDVDHTAIETE